MAIRLTTTSQLSAFIGVVLALLFWVIDALVMVVFFVPERSFLEALLQPRPIDLWVRLLVAALFIVFIILTSLLLRRKELAELRLRHISVRLEQLALELANKSQNLEQEISHRREIEAQLANLAITDQLTGVYNRRKFDTTLHDEIRQENRYPRGLALIMLDLDHFKAINDRHGHAVGDAVLKEFASLIATSIREADFFFRTGGEEFAIVTFAAEEGNLHTAAEKVRQRVASHDFPVIGQLHVSIGATRYRPGEGFDEIYRRADDALYQAKQQGRNRVILA